MENSRYRKTLITMLGLLAAIILAAVLKTASSVLIPLTLSLVLVGVAYPVCRKLNSIRIPWIISIAFVLLATAVVAIGLGGIIVRSLKSIVEVYPKYEERFTSLYRLFCTTFSIPFDENSSLWANLWNSLNVRKAVQDFALSLSSSIVSFLKVFMVVLLFMIFLLIELNPKKSLSKIDRAFKNPSTRKKINNIISGTVQDVTRYISIKFFVSLITGVLVWLCATVVKLDFAIIWGFLAFLLNFIPNFGSLISWALTTGFSVLQFYPSFGKVVFIALSVLAVNLVMGSFLEPRWEGKDLGVSPFVILVSLSFWGWMWGFVGMILAVPLTVVLKIAFENYSLLRPIAVIIGSGKDGRRKGSIKRHFKRKDENTPEDTGGLQDEPGVNEKQQEDVDEKSEET